MQSNYDACLTRVLMHEGGYTNDPKDPGGPTNFGITIYDYHKYAKPKATAADVKAMPLAVAKSIYKAKYWNALRCDDLPAGVDDSIFDYGVNSGVGRAGKVLRQLVGMPTNDWQVTDEVLAAVKKRAPGDLVKAINRERLTFLQHLPTWSHFGRGWSTRVNEVQAFSLNLVAGAAVGAEPVRPAIVRAPAPGKGAIPQPAAPKGPTVQAGVGAVAGLGATHLGAPVWLVVGILGVIAVAVGVAWLKHHAQTALNTANQTRPMPGNPAVPVAA